MTTQRDKRHTCGPVRPSAAEQVLYCTLDCFGFAFMALSFIAAWAFIFAEVPR